eukprot:s439_g8.t1
MCEDAADHAEAADSATITMPQPKLPPRPKKTFAQPHKAFAWIWTEPSSSHIYASEAVSLAEPAGGVTP